MKQDTVDRLCGLAIATAVFVVVVLLMDWAGMAWGGEVTYCSDSPTQGRSVYRIIDGYPCWFAPEPGMRRGREKPKEELRWPSYAPPPPMDISEPMRPPWAEEERFKGDGTK